MCGSFRALFLFFVALVACRPNQGDSSLGHVFEDDHRIPMTSKEFPWSAIGVLQADVGHRCTASIVGRDLVLTAAHCFAQYGKLFSGGFTFYPNVRGDDWGKGTRITEVNLGTYYPQDDRANDWAILKTKEPIGETFGWWGVAPVNIESIPTQLAGAGYSSDFYDSNYAGIDLTCHLRERLSVRKFLHDCDLMRGSSGGPFFAYEQKQILGLSTSQYQPDGVHVPVGARYDRDIANVGIPAANFYPKLIQLLRK